MGLGWGMEEVEDGMRRETKKDERRYGVGEYIMASASGWRANDA